MICRGIISFSIKVLRHEKLNQPSAPCEQSPDYDFADCIEKHVVHEVGCQIPWSRGTVEGIPMCDNSAEFIRYDKYISDVFFMPNSQLVRSTRCLLPCVFTEYKVSIIFSYFNF